MKDIQDLEKVITQQAAMIDQLKHAIQVLERRLAQVDKRTSRALEQSRQNSSQINSITNRIRGLGQ